MTLDEWEILRIPGIKSLKSSPEKYWVKRPFLETYAVFEFVILDDSISCSASLAQRLLFTDTYVAGEGPDTELLRSKLVENQVQTALAYFWSKPGSEEFSHLERLLGQQRLATKALERIGT